MKTIPKPIWPYAYIVSPILTISGFDFIPCIKQEIKNKSSKLNKIILK